MTTAQLQTLKTDITVTHAATVYNGNTLLQLWNAYDLATLAAYYNSIANPQVDLWRPNVTKTELSRCIVASEFGALTVANQNTWFAILQTETLDATIASVRTNFTTIFTSGATLTNLTAAAKKTATNFENLFTTGNVSSVYGQVLTTQDIYQAKLL